MSMQYQIGFEDGFKEGMAEGEQALIQQRRECNRRWREKKKLSDPDYFKRQSQRQREKINADPERLAKFKENDKVWRKEWLKKRIKAEANNINIAALKQRIIAQGEVI